VKRSVLRRMGGWPEDTVTEDIDLSTKIFATGLYSKYINPAECRGLLPQSFSGLCGQTFRWSYGTTRTFLLRWREVMRIPGVLRKVEHFLSLMTYFLGPAIIGIDLIMIVHLLFKVPIFHIYEVKTLWIFGALFTMSAFLALLYVQVRDNDVSIKRIVSYLLAIYGLSFNFTLGVLSALAGRRLAFFRTPRYAKKKNYRKLAARYWPETLIGSVSVAAGLLNLLNPLYAAQAGWAILFGVGFLTAPYLAFRYG
jgi:cellulose synthase/poly-beta-1,6-N-acetylglucosamine synthase-like glycosyltransferase